LQHKYEVSCKELDVLVDIARGVEGVIGSRMMGGGFGGCTINLVRTDSVDSFKKKVSDEYSGKTGLDVVVYETTISDGTQIIKRE